VTDLKPQTFLKKQVHHPSKPPLSNFLSQNTTFQLQSSAPIIAIMAERYIPEHRRTQFKAKNTFKPEELRRRREEQQVEIRKQKREENLAKRRGIGTGENRPGASLGAAPDSDDDTAPTESQVRLYLCRALPGGVWRRRVHGAWHMIRGDAQTPQVRLLVTGL